MKLSVFFVAICVLVLLSGSCRHRPDTGDRPSPPPAQELYEKALTFYEKKNYLEAQKNFETLRTRYPLSEWGVRAELRTADCQYYLSNYESALVRYQEFTQLHPTFEFIDYAYYQMGMCYYQQLCSIDRDQTPTQQALLQFERLCDRFPSSLYVPAAQDKIKECKTRLADHIVYIADFYYRTGAYASALSRYLEAGNTYLGYISYPDNYLFQLGKTYLRLDQPDKARDHFLKLLQEYPESSLAPLCEDVLNDPTKIEDIDKIKVTRILKKLNPLRALPSIPLPFGDNNEEPE
ncbi:MAG: outer membrane protein assembly factor BamD [Deltaproteobacteria bacterium]|nr:outer membrane protein assembly factor BamD [Deltaproteobacteria bacterium]